MNKKEYRDLVNRLTPKEKAFTNGVNAFIMGGVLGFMGEGLKLLILQFFNVTVSDAISWVLLIYIFLASLFTALGFFDEIAMKFRCGIIIPITGFAHSITSAALDYKSDGLITGLGSYFFKLSGCVLLYGIVSAFIMALLKVIIYA